MAPQLETLQIEQLSPQFTGELLRQGDSGYDDARLVWNGLFDRRPALIARCTSARDVAAAIEYGRGAGCQSRCAAAVTACPATARATAGS
jgi:hypothetical protein